MNQNALLLPAMVLAGWTLTVLLLVPYRRFQAALRRQVTAEDFRYGESDRVPPVATLANRHLMNLLEMPVLFYAVCLTLVVTRQGTATALALAWTYVGLRLLHSVVHLTYNNVMHRLSVFATSNLVLTALWLLAFAGLLR